MNSPPHLDVASGPRRRYGEVTQQKSSGATYTPMAFAAFVADHMVQVAQLPDTGPIRILDPACGDGALLHALIARLPAAVRSRIDVLAYDIDGPALQAAGLRLRTHFPGLAVRLEQQDFLLRVIELQGRSQPAAATLAPFHLVIANPPYVRTQIIGAQQAQQLARNFGLTGRVDLYYPFLLGISAVLAENGVAGVITSNRFMTTRSGKAVRRALLSRFRLLQAWDLGDTKLFGAAVLPSLLIARGSADAHSAHTDGVRYSSIYATRDAASANVADALTALRVDDDTVVALADGRRFRVRHGLLDNGGDAEGTWRVATGATDHWLATVAAHTWDTFRRIGKIRVGVKSTADKVFVRSDWNALAGGRPELLRPLITRQCARRFKAAVPARASHIKEILYPHESVGQGRAAVDLSLYPRAARYLAAHRDTLSARSYLIDAGRQWYELWVPHNPAAWPLPKIVFPDIADKPIFWIDTDGGVVNGECYWLQCDDAAEQDLLWLAIAVGNSTFIERFYDHRFNNKLYAGRRRFITQYVELFPLPDPLLEASKAIIAMAKLIHAKTPSRQADQLALKLDGLVWRAFGLEAAAAR
ncbi:Eco57I restriction-modification methylase domain-containing protein [Massilia sp. PWRC2]|uniref:Eco57I restriction-modification methylase domain-containing protein n=1 Tax=Massilia sp. PWRC2 TaxID=2804626 RepID=UPI003CF51697